jgi:CDP-glucose 4,6-dehydratase
MHGKSKFILKSLSKIEADSTNTYNFVISFKGNESFKKASKSISFKDANIEAKLVTKDSINYITATLIDKEKNSPISDVILTIQIQRLFKPLKIGDEFNNTDENGTISVIIEEGIPGVDGNLAIEVVLKDSDDYGTVKAIVNVTSDKCYDNKEWIWGYRENDAMGGHDPYSASKGCAELIASSYRASFFNLNDFGSKHNVLLASCRAGNVIGGGDWAEDRLIPDIMRAVSCNEKVEIRNPRATRPWQHVLEPLSGYLQIGQKLAEGDVNFAEAWNFGPDDNGSISVQEVVENIKQFWPKIDYKLGNCKNAVHEANLLKLDCSKAHIKLKWQGVWDSKMTFKRTVEWYHDFYEKKVISSNDDLVLYIEDAKTKGLEWTK